MFTNRDLSLLQKNQGVKISNFKVKEDKILTSHLFIWLTLNLFYYLFARFVQIKDFFYHVSGSLLRYLYLSERLGV